MKKDKSEYEKIPILVCSKCLSISIYSEDAIEPNDEFGHSDEYRYCLDCGSHKIISHTVAAWEKKYMERYGVKYLEGV